LPECDSILLGHETYSLVKDDVAADELASAGRVIREETDGFKLLLDLQKRDKTEIVAALETIIARLKE
jgi:hypothetical protein